MTVMIGISMLLIAASAVALGFGWLAANESLIWASIAATSVAAILLALAYYRSIKAVRTPVDIDALTVEHPEPEPEPEPEPPPP